MHTCAGQAARGGGGAAGAGTEGGGGGGEVGGGAEEGSGFSVLLACVRYGTIGSRKTSSGAIL